VQWLRDRLGAIADAVEVASLAARADPQQRLYLVPGFIGSGHPIGRAAIVASRWRSSIASAG
jgi:glycerol kinase